MARAYSNTGLAGRVTHVANVRRSSRGDMGPPPVPVPRAPVSAAFDSSDKDTGFDDDYISQPAPLRRSRAMSRSRPRAASPEERGRPASRSLVRAGSRSRDRSSSRGGFSAIDDRSRPPSSVSARASSASRARASHAHSVSPAGRMRSASLRPLSPVAPRRPYTPTSPLTPNDSSSPPRPPSSPSPSPAPRPRVARTEASASSPIRPRTLLERPASASKAAARADRPKGRTSAADAQCRSKQVAIVDHASSEET
ncbi:hypothetical protein HDZ31DRAFT_68597 [Schizophyllum fasciatum]